jgi:hypothetical protein
MDEDTCNILLSFKDCVCVCVCVRAHARVILQVVILDAIICINFLVYLMVPPNLNRFSSVG